MILEPQELFEFLKEDEIFVNEFDIHVESNPDGFTMYYLFPEPDKEDHRVMVGLEISCDSAEEFISVLNLKNARDLNLIGPEELEFMFEEGKAELYCCIINSPNPPVINYWKENGDVYLHTQSYVQHRVETDLVSHDDFIRYTKKYLQTLQEFEKGTN